MKVLWAQDMNPFRRQGGAQLTDYRHILEGIRRGHEVDVMAVEDGAMDPEAPCDVAIVSNATNVPATFFQRLVARQVPLVFLHHDYSCRWRLFYPMRDKCRACYLRDRWLPYYLRARLHIWLSPLHRQAWLHEYPELAESPYALVPSPVSAKDFFPMGQERRGVLVPSGLLDFKGRANILRWAEEHPDVPLTAIRYGDEEPLHLPGNITLMTTQPAGAMNALYNRHETVLHLPSTPQPFERICLPPTAKIATRTGHRNIRDVQPGDEVLTHMGRYRRVIETSHRTQAPEEATVKVMLRVSRSRKFGELALTELHPVLTTRGWIPANQLTNHDRVVVAARPCPTCGKLMYKESRHCSIACGNADRPYAWRRLEVAQLHLTDIQSAQIGGFFDGEGSIVFRRDRRSKQRPGYSCYLMVTNTNRAVLEQFKAWTGFGTIRTHRDANPKHRQCFRWYMEQTGQVAALLRAIRPFLIVKAGQADEALDALVFKDDIARNGTYTTDHLLRLHEAYRNVSLMNSGRAVGLLEAPKLILPQPIADNPMFTTIGIRVSQHVPKHRKAVYNIAVEEDQSYVAAGIVVHNCAEAILAGCRVVANELVGALSFPWFRSSEEVAQHCGGAPEQFWNAVTAVMEPKGPQEAQAPPA